MPYIKKEDRYCYNTEFLHPQNAGDLNYIFTKIIRNYINGKGQKYQNYNDVIGALECCKLELYRRKISSYEDTKIIENGDV